MKSITIAARLSRSCPTSSSIYDERTILAYATEALRGEPRLILEELALAPQPPREASAPMLAREGAIEIGRQIARAEFARRGNHSEAHLGEGELAALASLAAIGADVAIRRALSAKNLDPRDSYEVNDGRSSWSFPYTVEGLALAAERLAERKKAGHPAQVFNPNRCDLGPEAGSFDHGLTELEEQLLDEWVS